MKTPLRAYCVVHANCPQLAEEYGKALTEALNMAPAYIMSISPVVALHDGLGAVGIATMEE